MPFVNPQFSKKGVLSSICVRFISLNLIINWLQLATNTTSMCHIKYIFQSIKSMILGFFHNLDTMCSDLQLHQ